MSHAAGLTAQLVFEAEMYTLALANEIASNANKFDLDIYVF